MRLTLIAVLVAGAAGLKAHEAPDPHLRQANDAGTGIVSADYDSLDPELTNTAGEKFHVTQAGEYVMIGLPPTCDPESPDTCDLILKASFDKLENDSACNDLMIRGVTIQGTKLALGTNGVTKVEFSILNDVGNSSSALGFAVNDAHVAMEDFNGQVPPCIVAQERGYFKWPTRRSNRFRTKTYMVECDLAFAEHKFKLDFHTVWRGTGLDTGLPVYANDISFSIGNVGTNPIGIQGTDDISAVTAAVPGCDKKQPVSGPYQVRHGPKFPKRHHWR
jgi:hypothetical protein